LVTPDSLLQRLADENFGTQYEEDEDEDKDSVEKFLKDVTQLMDGK
jgi:hypothetical protein